MSNVAPIAEPAPQPDAEPIVYLTLVSKEGKEMKISELAAKQSVLIANMLALQVVSAPIPFDNISEETLKMVVTWCEQHKGEAAPKEDESIPKKGEIPEWDAKFLEIDNDALFDLIVAANYFDIKQLMNYTCKLVANMGKGKSPEEMRVIFGISTDEEDEAEDKAKQAEETKKKANS